MDMRGRRKGSKSESHVIAPQWIIVEDEVHHVSDFKHLDPGRRPETACPVCKRQVILALGEVYVHHYRHHPGDICAVSQPETALHLNAKLHIARELKKRLPLYLEKGCDGYYGCAQTKPVLWLDEWDEVQVEYAVDAYRPDVALLRDNRIVAAVEVVVTHAIEPAKEAYFDEQRIAWVEVHGTEDMYTGESAWDARQPLPPLVQKPELEEWTCSECLARAEAERERIARQEAARLEQERNKTYIHRARMVDFFYPSTKRYREALYVKVKLKDGKRVRAWVEREGWKRLGVVVRGNPLSQEHFKQLSRYVREYIELRRQKYGAIVDYRTEWVSWVRGKKFHPRDLDRYPFRYEWNSDKRKWQRLEDPGRSRVTRNLQRGRSIADGEHNFGPYKPAAGGMQVSKCGRCGAVRWVDEYGELRASYSFTCPG